jgi:hypothetical protein
LFESTFHVFMMFLLKSSFSVPKKTFSYTAKLTDTVEIKSFYKYASSKFYMSGIMLASEDTTKL